MDEDGLEGIELAELFVRDHVKEVVIGEVLDKERTPKGKGKEVDTGKNDDKLKRGDPRQLSTSGKKVDAGNVSSPSADQASAQSDADDHGGKIVHPANTFAQCDGKNALSVSDLAFQKAVLLQQYLDATEKGHISESEQALELLYAEEGRSHGHLLACPSLSTIQEGSDEGDDLGDGVPVAGISPTAVKTQLRRRVRSHDAAFKQRNDGSDDLDTAVTTALESLPFGPNSRAGYDGVKNGWGQVVQGFAVVSTFFDGNSAVAEYDWFSWTGFKIAEGFGVLLLWMELALLGTWTVVKWNPRTFIVLSIVGIYCRAKHIPLDEVVAGIIEDLAMKGKIVLGRA
ncbi:hypothetical protein CALCODRAFT_485058 [Calocera cornea HHB12733]|uniref:Uncharacterized protein n=1 Tax=Calocera cornea HHB12733 TaxID=1353952 RepID=A0A165ELU2_9BASI|nr:hypothetical protein CALCODRAFT_485058 [Calocera cornea HHB12733]